MLQIAVYCLFLLVSFGFAKDEYIKDEDVPELKYLNKKINPCDDFYEFTCGNFKKHHPLQNGETTIDQFTLLEDEITNLAKILLSAKDKIDDPVAVMKARAAYNACINTKYADLLNEPEMTIVEEEGGFPLVQSLMRQPSSEISKERKVAFNWNDIGRLVGKYGVPMMFTLQSYSDLVDTTKNLIYLHADTLENPALFRPFSNPNYEEVLEKDFSRATADKQKSTLAPFDIFLRKIAFKIRKAAGSFLSDEVVVDNIAILSNFMKGIYSGGYIPTNTTIRSFSGMSVTLDELNEWTVEHFGNSVEIDWIEYMRNVFQNSGVDITGDTTVLSSSTLAKLLYGILNWVNRNDPDTVKSFVLMRIFLYMAPDSDHETRAAFEEYYTGLNNEIPERSIYCTRKVIDLVGTAGLSFAATYEYQLHYFNADRFNKAIQMIKDLQSSFKEIIDDSAWMENETKEVAKEKIDNLVTILGYPDFVEDKRALDKFYENVRICKWDNYGNSRRIRAFKQAYQLSQLSKRDRAFWDRSPFEVNAYYSRPNNKMTFPLAMLNPAFFGNKARVLDYGRMGSVVGHEITHGFDNQGRLYDQTGALSTWWSSTTKANFDELVDCFVDQYDRYYVDEIGAHVNGSTTLNENIADNGGVRESYKAMEKLLSRSTKRSNLRTSSFTVEQLFFIGYGTMWCNNPSESYLQSTRDGAHAVSKFRVNGVVSNMDEFSEAFECPIGSEMNPRDKCKLW